MTWNLQENSIKEGFYDCFLNNHFTDIKLVFKDKQSLLLHKLVLAASSAYLKSCLNISHEEDLSMILLPDFEISDFRILLPYLYGCTNEFNSSLSTQLIQTLQMGTASKTEEPSANHLDFEMISKPFSEDTHWLLDDIVGSAHDEDDPPVSPKYEKNLENIHCFKCYLPHASIQDLQIHVKINPKCAEKNYFCPECPKVFDSSIKVIRHKVVHRTNVTKFVCTKCQKSFKSKKILDTHQRKVHGIHANMKYQCSQCPHSFNFENHLKAHTQNKHKPGSSNEPDFFCEHCDMTFTSRSALSYHTQKHLKPRHQCPKCPKSFKSEFGLNYHLKIHNNEAHYLCDDCGKKFISPYKLIQHRRAKHTLERPFICEECGEGFVRNDKLTVHRRRAHTGERPYPCDSCDWRGVDSSSLIHHRKKHVKQDKKPPTELENLIPQV